jgi:hypothetical protein
MVVYGVMEVKEALPRVCPVVTRKACLQHAFHNQPFYSQNRKLMDLQLTANLLLALAILRELRLVLEVITRMLKR